MIARVVVVPKPVVNDPQGVTVRQGLNALGFAEVSDVRVGKYIEVQLEDGAPDRVRARVDQMCRQLLANGVIEDYRFELSAPERAATQPSATGGGLPGGAA
jgi:phosphoribosylformylglycinamidine synthase subunit PurS